MFSCLARDMKSLNVQPTSLALDALPPTPLARSEFTDCLSRYLAFFKLPRVSLTIERDWVTRRETAEVFRISDKAPSQGVV